MNKITVLGSTGSIGTQTLDIARQNSDIKVCALAADSSVDKMEAQAREFLPEAVCLYNEAAAAELKVRLADLPVRVLSGMDGLIEISAASSADIVVAAIVGMVGIRPVIAAMNAGKDIALANKETLVTAGHIIMPLAKEKNVRILPVDSEHSAIFQALRGNDENRISRILLTASGGPFRGRTREEMKSVRPEDALRHPNWSMGRKITIDSATMVNKGLEVMEARWLFDVEYDDIEVVIQPDSIIHSMVEYEDGAVIAQLGVPDMKLAIQYALYYPQRKYLPGDRLDFKTMCRIEVAEPDTRAFPGLALAYRAGRAGGTVPTVYNAANEWAVARFLDYKLGFTEIAETIEECMDRHTAKQSPTISEILETEAGVNEFLNYRGR